MTKLKQQKKLIHDIGLQSFRAVGAQVELEELIRTGIKMDDLRRRLLEMSKIANVQINALNKRIEQLFPEDNDEWDKQLERDCANPDSAISKMAEKAKIGEHEDMFDADGNFREIK